MKNMMMPVQPQVNLPDVPVRGFDDEDEEEKEDEDDSEKVFITTIKRYYKQTAIHKRQISLRYNTTSSHACQLRMGVSALFRNSITSGEQSDKASVLLTAFVSNRGSSYSQGHLCFFASLNDRYA